MTFTEKIRDFLARRKRRKLLAEYKSIRHAEDDLLDEERKREFDAVIEILAHSDAPHDNAMAAAREGFARINHGIKHRALREILDLVLVVGAVAAGIRGLFLQPFRIPTGSMQPTLYGIHYRYKDGTWRDKLPAALQFAIYGRRRAELTVRSDGRFDPQSVAVADGALKTDTSFRIGDETYTLPGDARKVLEYAELFREENGEYVPDTEKLRLRGEKLADGFTAIGDHLFVERCSLYLAPPKRGDVMVFNTENLKVESQGRSIPLSELSGYYYIKRVVGLPGDTLRIKDGFLYVKPKGEKEFRRADELDPRFKKIFSRKGGYQGYTNEPHARFLCAPDAEFMVPARHYFMLGDNTDFSMDSRFFGAVPRRNLVGRALFVFWPVSRRWGVADTKAPLDVPTEKDGRNFGTYRVMYRQ
jgi:signal peptidase I